MASKSMVAEITNRVYDHLLQTCVTDVDNESDKAGAVLRGRLLDEYNVFRITLEIRPGDETWKHEVDTGASSLPGFTGYMMGGGTYWRRRFRIDVNIYLEGTPDYADSMEIAYAVLSRVGKALRDLVLPRGADEFGESALELFVDKEYLEDSGGEDMRIWRGSIYFTVRTFRS